MTDYVKEKAYAWFLQLVQELEKRNIGWHDLTASDVARSVARGKPQPNNRLHATGVPAREPES